MGWRTALVRLDRGKREAVLRKRALVGEPRRGLVHLARERLREVAGRRSPWGVRGVDRRNPWGVVPPGGLRNHQRGLVVERRNPWQEPREADLRNRRVAREVEHRSPWEALRRVGLA